jgi:hypothetical protein
MQPGAGQAKSIVPKPAPLQYTAFVPEQSMKAFGVQVQADGIPLHVKPVSIVQLALHPSPLVVLPSSHCSALSTIPSPQTAMPLLVEELDAVVALEVLALVVAALLLAELLLLAEVLVAELLLAEVAELLVAELVLAELVVAPLDAAELVVAALVVAAVFVADELDPPPPVAPEVPQPFVAVVAKAAVIPVSMPTVFLSQFRLSVMTHHLRANPLSSGRQPPALAVSASPHDTAMRRSTVAWLWYGRATMDERLGSPRNPRRPHCSKQQR